ncbi:MAG: hypothetical protein HFE74_04590 [Firmicutes bacterium]|jgi:hypothetical protein|nr:hypothetical protein [Bacillota bacterium]
MECPKCKAQNIEQANFCKNCGYKLKQVCNCWVENRAYDCGKNSCPGFLIKYKKSQTD